MRRKTSTDHQGIERTWVIPETVDEITDDMLAVVIYAIEWQDDEPRIDYEDLWDRIESSSLPDGSYIGLPSATDDPIYAQLRKIALMHRADLGCPDLTSERRRASRPYARTGWHHVCHDRRRVN